MRKQSLLTNSIKPLLTGMMVAGLLVTSIQSALAESICFAVADNDRDGDEDVLVMMYKDGRTVEIGGGLTGSLFMEAITFDLSGKVLYAANGDTLGILNLDNGQFEPKSHPFGTGDGSEGLIEFSDIDGMTFDFSTGILYATHRREHTEPQSDNILFQHDILFQVDPITGKFKPGVFGGADYVVVQIEDQLQYHDVDDIASDPTDGTLYIVANTGDGVESVLATLNKNTGVATLVGVIQTAGEQTIDDIESLSFEPDGTLHGSTGNGGAEKGLANPKTKNQLYQIDKTTGIAASLGKLMPPLAVDGVVQKDFEAISCVDRIPPPRECVMYALHDEGKNDTQIIKIEPNAGAGQVGVVSTVGPMYRGLDLEGMAIIPAENENELGKLYATSGYHAGKVKKGVVVEVAGEDGHLYEVDREAGLVKPIGSTGYSEVSALCYNRIDKHLYGWARGVNKNNRYEIDENGNKIPKVGLIKIDPATGASEMVFRAPGYKDPDIEGLACSEDGTKFYGSADNDLWVYDTITKEFKLQCENMVKAEVEALEMQPNGLLLMGTDGDKELGMVAYDLEKCEVVATRSYQNLIYDDIESIEWPATECVERSWLYTGSGDAEIELIAYEAVPAEVEEALRVALKESGLDDAAIETDDGKVTVYYAGMTFTAQALETSRARKGRDDEDNSIEVTDANLAATENRKGIQYFDLQFEDADGKQYSWGLFPASPDKKELDKTIEGVDAIKRANIKDDGSVTVVLETGQKITGQVSQVSTEANVLPGQPLKPVKNELICDNAAANCECTMIYSDTTTQCVDIAD